jgi:hypothetical protein
MIDYQAFRTDISSLIKEEYFYENDYKVSDP